MALLTHKGDFMKVIIQSYHISNETLALLLAREIEYDTIVMKEGTQTKHVRQTAFNLIKLACYTHDWTTYEGRREAIVKQTGFKRKTPILISIVKDIYFFPTHSPNHVDNIWISFHHILMIGKIPRKRATK